MNKYIVWATIGSVVLVGFFLFVIFIGAKNGEARLRNAIGAKQKDNKSEFDNMWKKISQVAQVTDAQRSSLMEIFTSYANARNQGGGGTLSKWIHESVPNVDTTTFNNLQNIITSSRDRWTQRQKELLDMKREHDNMLDTFPSDMVLSVLGKERIDVVIVTSARTEKAFDSGADDDVDVFQKKQVER
jgi:hypothetical protein